MDRFESKHVERTILPEWKKHLVWQSVAYPVLIIAVMWSMWALYAFFGIDVITLLKRQKVDRDIDPGTMYLYMGIGFSVVAIGYGWHGIRKALRLAARGILVDAKCNSVSVVSFKGLCRVDSQYELDGVRYDFATTVAADVFEEYQSGARRMVLVVDPADHRRAMNADDVFPRDVILELCPDKNDAEIRFDQWSIKDVRGVKVRDDDD